MPLDFNQQPENRSDAVSLDSFYIKLPQAPQITSADALRTEKELLEKLRLHGPRHETLKPLAIFYSRVGQQETAYRYIKTWTKHVKDSEDLAECLCMSGQLAEQVDQPKTAIAFYQEGLGLKPKSQSVNYFLQNNLGYCLNLQTEYHAALKHCEAAIAIDPSRANAYKNMGTSLMGLGRYAEAAKTWVKAVHVDASDGRSLELLETLMLGQPDAIRLEIPDIDAQVEHCRHAVTSAKSGRFADWARGLTYN